MEIPTLTDRYAKVTIHTDDEGISFLYPVSTLPSVKETTEILVARFLTDKPIRCFAMQQVLASVWRPVRGVRIIDATFGKYLFEFPMQKEALRILEEGPWSFDNRSLLLKLLKDGESLVDVVLDRIQLWVQIFNLPFGYTSNMVLEQIGNFLGKFLKLDENKFQGSWRSFYCVRVELDVSKPLRKSMKLTKRDENQVLISFKYERLHTFCYFCGIIGHTDRYCEGALLSDIPPSEYPFDGDLRANQRRRSKGIGSSWLISDNENSDLSPITHETTHEHSGNDPNMDSMALILKRRRADSPGTSYELRGDDEIMEDASKNLQKAGSSLQTRLVQ